MLLESLRPTSGVMPIGLGNSYEAIEVAPPLGYDRTSIRLVRLWCISETIGRFLHTIVDSMLRPTLYQQAVKQCLAWCVSQYAPVRRQLFRDTAQYLCLRPVRRYPKTRVFRLVHQFPRVAEIGNPYIFVLPSRRLGTW